MKQVALFSLLLLIANCSREDSSKIDDNYDWLENVTIYPDEVNPASKIQLTKEQRFGNTDEVIIGRITSLSVDDQGRVYISEGSRNLVSIYVFNRDGSYLETMGSFGEGPGEFQSIIDTKIRGDYLFALDHTQFMAQVFSLNSLTYSHSIPINSDKLKKTYPPIKIAVLSDGNFLVGLIQFDFDDQLERILYYRLNSDGDFVTDKILSQDHIRYIQDPVSLSANFSPFHGRALMAVSSNDKLYSARTDDFLIKVYDLDGRYLRAFHYPIPKRKLTLQEAENYFKESPVQRALKSSDLPDTWPILNTMLIDEEDRLWVSITRGDNFYDWWILDKSGELLATFELPGNQHIRIVKSDALYIIENDSETGLESIIRYGFEIE